MNDEGYCYDDQFKDLSDWLCTISGQLEEIKEAIKNNNNPIGITHTGKHIHSIRDKKSVTYDSGTGAAE